MIPNTQTFIQALSTGVNTAYSYPNKIDLASDLSITAIDTSANPHPFAFQSGAVFSSTALGLTATVTGVDVDTGCLVTLSAPLPANWSLDVRSLIPETQTTSIKNQGQFLPDLHEEAFDRATRQIQDLYRLSYTFGIHGPDIEATPWPALPSASVRANQGLVFDPNGLPAMGVLPNVPLTQALVGLYIYPPLPFEGSSVVFMYYPYFDVRRYGGVGNGLVDDHVAVQTAFTVAGNAGGTVIFPGGFTFLCNADIIVPVALVVGGPVACAQGPGWATPSVIFGSGSTFGFIFLGTGATTDDVTSGAYNYAGTFRDLGITLTGTAGHAFYCNSVNQPRIESCWVRGSGTNAAGAYFINCLLPVFHSLVTGCGSATQGSVEFDSCTTPNTDGMRISGGVTTVGGLIADRCTNFVGRGMSIESCGIPIRVGHKAESSLAFNGFDFDGLELENPGSTTYIDIGAGLTGGALVLNGRITAWRGAPAPTATVAFGIRVQNCAGLDIGSSLVTQGAAPISFLEIIGTNVSGIVVRANRLLQANAYPWVRYNGTQVKHAGCQMDWQLGVTNAGVPVCTSRGLDEMQASAQTGAIPNPSLGAAGGFMRSFQLAQSGSTTLGPMPILEAGAEVYIYHADAFSTYPFGSTSGLYITKSGINLTPAGGTFVGWKSNGTAWSQIA